jgi:hypothetical protein
MASVKREPGQMEEAARLLLCEVALSCSSAGLVEEEVCEDPGATTGRAEGNTMSCRVKRIKNRGSSFLTIGVSSEGRFRRKCTARNK